MYQALEGENWGGKDYEHRERERERERERGRVGFSLPTEICNKPLDSNVKDIHNYTQKFKQKISLSLSLRVAVRGVAERYQS